ncbi:uncharacterized protein PV09_07721 [Verruconis gallopava]|uniref:Fumarylacetoacetase-like C-terminal domain-containing protein n=1 Tax=Verruconis gallopava TaxID=253628 RepID=A0A0D1YIP0_9PEZI|nr:uncharacterized protein PV09_07721 [Verruconis gallopava]KIW00737.1 hypothetical protein PV09_07721 [Verruconis gallopava]
MAAWKRLIRFVPKGNASKILIGEPSPDIQDVGAALYKGQPVTATVFSGSSVLSPGNATGEEAEVDRVLSPLQQSEVGTIRCIGLNYKQHAAECGFEIPKIPSVFMKPETSLGDPWPAPVPLPKATQRDDSGDYESELAVVISKDCKNVSEADAPNYILGYTASNDVSSRTAQFATTQWSHSKSFDGACPIGPVLVSPELIPDPAKLHLRGLHNGQVVQDCGIDDLIFSVPKIISHLSEDTTLKAGTLIITGTPAGVGVFKKPKLSLKAGDVFTVEILPYIGSLINKFENA